MEERLILRRVASQGDSAERLIGLGNSTERLVAFGGLATWPLAADNPVCG